MTRQRLIASYLFWRNWPHNVIARDLRAKRRQQLIALRKGTAR